MEEPKRKRRASRRIRSSRRNDKGPILLPLEQLEYRSPHLTQGDVDVISKQLGYTPVNLISVGGGASEEETAAEATTFPRVALLYPLNANELGGRYSAGGGASSKRNERKHKPEAFVGGFIEACEEEAVDEEEAAPGSLNLSAGEREEAEEEVLVGEGERKEENEEEGGGEEEEEDPRKPFPTMLWMTCPLLHARICKLEDLGWIAKLETRLRSSEQFLADMSLAHARYAEARWSLLSQADVSLVEAAGWTSALRHVGIAGIRDATSVKCLHCHYAHHLVRREDGNVIGQWVHELLQEGEA